LDQHLRVDHAAGADHALLALEDPGGNVLQLERLAVGDDRVARVRPAVVAADEIGMLGKQVDDLALALVAPLRAYNDGCGHQLSPGAQWVSRGRAGKARTSSKRRPASGRLGAPTITVAGTSQSLPDAVGCQNPKTCERSDWPRRSSCSPAVAARRRPGSATTSSPRRTASGMLSLPSPAAPC